MKESIIVFLSRVITVAKRAVSRVHPFVLVVSCVGILIAYLVGMYATGTFHKASRWMGALLACTSVVMVLQAETFRNSLRPAWMRMLGTFIGVVIGYIYLRYFHFSIIHTHPIPQSRVPGSQQLGQRLLTARAHHLR